ncbi:MAG: hypothetical protein IK020_04030 [Clostridiales bacterium]|nr:hypothetical protein [Clostridiales bacterium]
MADTENTSTNQATESQPKPAAKISRAFWPVVFFCEAALVITIVVLIVLFSVPTERKLMDTVRELYHAKEVKYDQFSKKTNVYTMMNFDERRKGNGAMKDDLMDNVEMHFMYRDGNDAEGWYLTIRSLHFASHNAAREYFNTFDYANPRYPADEYTPVDWYEYADSRVKELAFHNSADPDLSTYDSYICDIMYLEGKSVVLIRFVQQNDIDEARRDKLAELCDELSLPDPLELENTWEEQQE